MHAYLSKMVEAEILSMFKMPEMRFYFNFLKVHVPKIKKNAQQNR